jgi:hypothetical protein
MATNLGSTGLTFNTVNMKPETDEQIDALWGQNLADNTSKCYWGGNDTKAVVDGEGTRIIGQLAYKARLDVQASDEVTTNYISPNSELFFYKKAEFDTLIGTMYGTVGCDSGAGNSVNGTAKLLVNGDEAYFWGTGPAGQNQDFTRSESFSYDISGLTDDQMYRITLDTNTTSSVDTLSFIDYNFGIFCTE